MSILSDIRSQLRGIITETDSSSSHFTDAELNGFINQAILFSAVQIEYPRDFTEIQVEQNVGAYTVPSDLLMIRTAYFGDKTAIGDVKPLSILSEETLKEIKTNWLEETTANTGRPSRIILLDRNTVFVDPRPDSTSAASGKKLYIGYVYNPASLTSDSQSPDLPVPFHDILQFYAAHLCYLRLQNDKMAASFKATYMNNLNLLKPAVTRETKEGFAWQFGYSDDVNDEYGYGGGIVFP